MAEQTITTKEPLPDGLEAKAIAWFEAWKAHNHAEMDKQLRGLSAAQSSLVQRRGQRFASGDSKPEAPKAAAE